MVKVLVAASGALIFALAISACGNKPKGPGCKTDKDCTAPLTCQENKCIEAKTAQPECTRDDQCPNGQVCQAGSCKACSLDADCGPGGTCKQGACQKAKKCTKDDECADDESCQNGYCLKDVDKGKTAGDATCPLQTVYFAFDQSAIETSERDRLDQNAQCVGKNKGKNVFLIGHTDSSGTEEYNIALSERRAQAVADYLARLGTDPARMQVVPKGETEPTGLGDDKDRRVEFQWH
ncbi:MAG TPA: OmpA family protein [Kofleriaceae bacterium]|jgi:peptidoglycan-associated lipoprotein